MYASTSIFKRLRYRTYNNLFYCLAFFKCWIAMKSSWESELKYYDNLTTWCNWSAILLWYDCFFCVFLEMKLSLVLPGWKEHTLDNSGNYKYMSRTLAWAWFIPQHESRDTYLVSVINYTFNICIDILIHLVL